MKYTSIVVVSFALGTSTVVKANRSIEPIVALKETYNRGIRKITNHIRYILQVLNSRTFRSLNKAYVNKEVDEDGNRTVCRKDRRTCGGKSSSKGSRCSDCGCSNSLASQKLHKLRKENELSRPYNHKRYDDRSRYSSQSRHRDAYKLKTHKCRKCSQADQPKQIETNKHHYSTNTDIPIYSNQDTLSTTHTAIKTIDPNLAHKHHYGISDIPPPDTNTTMSDTFEHNQSDISSSSLIGISTMVVLIAVAAFLNVPVMLISIC
ncbi:hypothetical protein BASA50_003748 [Batrachochytrium salamandrivorans]|uniref:Uncharacterized protein n=1 Tax=Batrachochytrium salamandrivorans TaxID=1357716 RepID=A0ABQ8FIC9_9FUNG|nr:hypothetical protein BASA62_005970 [Batrachochytrium salamandrivorans]KAH6598714.1 hypothetical protein BASA50_003748 [Batrachochytrium salamandrivorans]KAH9264179.1 hypothetical protein BASA83_012378 [Batrachochytrium salamandrivorans]KAJ1342485.1 hypothetical protein BSLG_002927 [Batrachochytrium salamandrivorans]